MRLSGLLGIMKAGSGLEDEIRSEREDIFLSNKCSGLQLVCMHSTR